MNNITPTFQGEVMLAGWSETHTGGCKVTFWLPDGSALEPFKSATVRKGNTAGQRYMAVLVELGPDDRPMDQDKPRTPLLMSALMLCRTSAFQGFAGARTYAATEDGAATCIKDFCGIGSRKDLDTNRHAAEQFARLMHIYREWCRENGVQV